MDGWAVAWYFYISAGRFIYLFLLLLFAFCFLLFAFCFLLLVGTHNSLSVNIDTGWIEMEVPLLLRPACE
jgi:hypothetical protein